MEIRKYLALSILVFLFLTSCSEVEEVVTQKTIDNNFNNNSNKWVYKLNTIAKKTLNNDDSIKELQIDETCIGCGKCIMIAPENFVMNIQTFKAEVISQKDIHSEEVQASINICPSESISIG